MWWLSWPPGYPPGRSCWCPEPGRCRWRCCAPRVGWWSSGSRSWPWITRRPAPCWKVPGRLDDAEVNEGRADRGWPVGLYLAALAHKAGGPPRHAWAGFTGMTGSWPTTCGRSCWASFHRSGDVLDCTAVLERMCGPLCDAVLDTTGSSDVLAWLEGSNLLLVP